MMTILETFLKDRNYNIIFLPTDCDAGYWCLTGSTTKAPIVASTLYDVCSEDPDIGGMKAGICPIGE